jgi:Fe-S oxidoreductase
MDGPGFRDAKKLTLRTTEMRDKTLLRDISKNGDQQLITLKKEELMGLPHPYESGDLDPKLDVLSEADKTLFEASLDGVSAILLPKPKSKAEEDELVGKFLSGLRKLLTRENNWTFLQPLMHSLDYCGKCLTCSQECPVYLASGKQDIYRPSYRSELLRRIKGKYIDGHGKVLSWIQGNSVELNWNTIARLAELVYRCTLCRRCTQACSRGVDNGLITHEIRKIFSQEMGIAPRELHEKGTMQHLKAGSSTGMTPAALGNIIEFIEEDIQEKTGMTIKVPVDKEGADILLIHNAGEYISWPENPAAFAVIFEAAGIDYTLSSELLGYDAVNYGVWYDDVQFSRIALKHAEIAKKLKVKRIMVGECGHSHKALIEIADRVLTGDLNIPRESCMTLLEDIVLKERLSLDPERNNFPVTLHDPCNMVRLMGIVEPQRRILRKICPQFREMEPHGVRNYCCGGGSGFAIMSPKSFIGWKLAISGRMKMKQTLETFQDVIGPETHKYLCAPCSNCKGQIRDLFNTYQVWDRCGMIYGGLVELIVNAMTDIKKPFISWEAE